LSAKTTLPVVSDLNGDGKVEIVAGQYVIDAETGTTLSTLNSLSMHHQIAHEQNFPVAADLDGDGHPEVIYGSDIYKFNNGFAASPAYWKRCPGMTAATNGVSMAGDINRDGNIDVVFAYRPSDLVCTVKAWTPSTGATLGSFQFNIANAVSYPFIGDIDGVVTNGTKYPEICINTAGHLYAYRYTGSGFALKWDFPHSDTSGATALTLFDFNLDGVVELVYRDETLLHIFSDAGNTIVNATDPIPCGSATIVETPVIADVNGDGSADIVVTGHPAGNTNSVYGELNVYEGAASKWASCPPVWNQQLYSPLHVNTDLTVPPTVASAGLTFYLPDNTPVQYYNGGPMQAPYINEATHRPIDLSPDVYVSGGTVRFNSSNSVTLDVTFGNMGMAIVPAGTPVQYYGNAVGAGNLIGSGTLGADLVPGQTHTVSRTLDGLSPMPTAFYVRILDDGTNFPAAGPYSDCNLTNNTKSFGTLELHKTVNSTSSCIDGTSIFYIELANNSSQAGNPQAFNNIQLIDSLGPGWQYIGSSALNGTLGGFNPATRSIQWSIASLAPGDTARMTLIAKPLSAGAIRNSVWIDAVDGAALGREVIEAYVIVNTVQAPAAAVISPASAVICTTPGSSATLTAAATGATSYQWYRNNAEITGATESTYTATSAGSYKVAYFNGTCVSQMSAAATLTADPCVIYVPVNPHLRSQVTAY
jgi:hypothetical protein